MPADVSSFVDASSRFTLSAIPSFADDIAVNLLSDMSRRDEKRAEVADRFNVDAAIAHDGALVNVSKAAAISIRVVNAVHSAMIGDGRVRACVRFT